MFGLNDIDGDLMVSLGGTTIVATDAVLAQAQLLHALRDECADWATRAQHIRQLDPMGDGNWPGQDPASDLLQVASRLHALELRCAEVADGLQTAARNYGYAERVAQQLALLGAAEIAHGIGRLLNAGLLCAAGTPLGVAVLVALLSGYLSEPSSGSAPVPKRAASGSGLTVDPRLLTNPAVVSLMRVIMSSSDDVGAGFIGVPRDVGRVLGDEGLGVIGVRTSALFVVNSARRRGLLRETPVTVAPVGESTTVRAPAGVAGLAAGIPKSAVGQPQVRIEKYGDSANPAWMVYIGGTVAWDAKAANEPWDLTADVTAMAAQESGSLAAVMAAMKASGIGPGDPVVVAGHSLGGLVASQLATVTRFNVQAVATFGAPESGTPILSGVATLTVEHTDDIVTATGGASLVDSVDRITVRREAFATTEPPAGTDVPAHHLDTYRETARLIDASPEANLQGFRAAVTGILGSGPGKAVMWRGIRSQSVPPAT